MSDAVQDLVHDHGALNRRVVALGARMRELDPSGVGDLVAPLTELREALFLHFAREEEGVFPFLEEALPDLAEQVREMATAHDAICGALARMLHLARSKAEPITIVTLHARFEQTYAAHAGLEASLLDSLQGRLDATQLARLGALVEGL